jgi:hypothetical protein
LVLRIPVNIGEFADMANALVDGGIIMSKIFQNRPETGAAVSLIKLIFQPDFPKARTTKPG